MKEEKRKFKEENRKFKEEKRKFKEEKRKAENHFYTNHLIIYCFYNLIILLFVAFDYSVCVV